MRLAVTADDISLDLNTALEVLQDLQCREFELRSLGLERIPDVDERWVAVAEKAVYHKRLRVAAMAPGFFLDAPPADDVAARCFNLAKRLRCDLISVYATRRLIPPEENEDNLPGALPPPEVLGALRTFIAAAQNAGCSVMLRTHPETFAATAEEAVALIEELGGPARVGLDWDVAASFGAGDDSGLESIPLVRKVLKAVHVRDAVRRGRGAEWVSMGRGVIPWEDILELLHGGGYRGLVIVEPGIAPKLRECRTAVTAVGRWIDACRLAPRDDRDD